MATARDIARYLDDILGTDAVPDYPGALNGLQIDHQGPVRRITAAVDLSLRVLDAVCEADANLLLVHHGMFWGTARPFVGAPYQRLRMLVNHDIAVYASHLPLDAHTALGNNALLANALSLQPTGRFAAFHGTPIGLSGNCDLLTHHFIDHTRAVVRPWGGEVRSTYYEPERRTRRWGICTGAGASSDTLHEAAALGIDTLLVGEGPHHTAVDAPDLGLVVVYAGHYATETFGIQAIARLASEHFGLPWSFIHVPSGL